MEPKTALQAVGVVRGLNDIIHTELACTDNALSPVTVKEPLCSLHHISPQKLLNMLRLNPCSWEFPELTLQSKSSCY